MQDARCFLSPVLRTELMCARPSMGTTRGGFLKYQRLAEVDGWDSVRLFLKYQRLAEGVRRSRLTHAEGLEEASLRASPLHLPIDSCDRSQGAKGLDAKAQLLNLSEFFQWIGQTATRSHNMLGGFRRKKGEQMEKSSHRSLPKRIILVRHGESQGNLDMAAYTTTPDYRIPLTVLGVEQARDAGERICQVVSEGGRAAGWKVYFYVSPYERTRSTLREMGRAFPPKRIIGVREECRIREQDFGNFQVEERMKAIKETRERFGRFFFRFPEGESAADVFDRVTSRETPTTHPFPPPFCRSLNSHAVGWNAGFMESLWRDIDMRRLEQEDNTNVNLVIVSHGLTSRVFLMKWFKWTVDEFERLNNPGNCEIRVMQLGPGGDYSLAIHHQPEELQRWGLSPEMIADQQWRATAVRGSWYDSCPWHLDNFFHHLKDSSEDDESSAAARDACGVAVSESMESCLWSLGVSESMETYPSSSGTPSETSGADILSHPPRCFGSPPRGIYGRYLCVGTPEEAATETVAPSHEHVSD
ncbi:hypothetical protein BHE74_00046757 [Ensete ventricosum]|nr:hypothetical protein BHE74_00046757 [Ensete ventricosum]